MTMTEIEYYIACLGEECSEVVQRVFKSQRFGLEEVQPGQNLNNADRIGYEFTDLLAVADILRERGILPQETTSEMMAAKQAKVNKYVEYSRRRGIIV